MEPPTPAGHMQLGASGGRCALARMAGGRWWAWRGARGCWGPHRTWAVECYQPKTVRARLGLNQSSLLQA